MTITSTVLAKDSGDVWRKVDSRVILTRRQVEFLSLYARGHSQKRIAAILKIDPRTVWAFADSLREKFKCGRDQTLLQVAVDLRAQGILK